MPAFTGSLNVNEIQASIYNMILGQYIHTNNIANTYDKLLNLFRRDVGLYGDQILHYATDAYKTLAYDPDSTTQANVLEIHRPPAPKCQAIQIDNARYIAVTIDDYFSKRAFATESVFTEYNATLIQWLQGTKNIYLSSLFNTYIGTTETAEGKQEQTVDLSKIGTSTTAGDEEAANRITASLVGQKIADLLVELADPIAGKDFNDYGFYRSYNPDDIVIVWNAAYFNKFRKVDLPTIFHDSGVIDKLDERYILPDYYFGTVNAEGGTVAASNATIRSLIETDYTVNKVTTHVFPGMLLPDGASYTANTTYTNKGDIVCKIMHRESVPVLNGMEGEKVFINGRNWSENHYLHFLVNTFEYLKDMPFITVKAVTA